MHFSDLARCNLRYWHIMSSDAHLDDSKCLPKHSRAFQNLEWSSRAFQGIQGSSNNLPGPSRTYSKSPRAFQDCQGLSRDAKGHNGLQGPSKSLSGPTRAFMIMFIWTFQGFQRPSRTSKSIPGPLSLILSQGFPGPGATNLSLSNTHPIFFLHKYFFLKL